MGAMGDDPERPHVQLTGSPVELMHRRAASASFEIAFNGKHASPFVHKPGATGARMLLDWLAASTSRLAPRGPQAIHPARAGFAPGQNSRPHLQLGMMDLNPGQRSKRGLALIARISLIQHAEDWVRSCRGTDHADGPKAGSGNRLVAFDGVPQ